MVDRAEYAELLKAAGHFNTAAVRKPNGRFYVTCECGYVSTTRVDLRQAVDTVEHHRQKALREFRANGVFPPGIRSATA